MQASFEKLAIAGLLSILSTAAGAQSIRPECKTFPDKIGCTCALNNGGWMSPGGRVVYSTIGKPPINGGQVNQAFINCMARVAHGRRG